MTAKQLRDLVGQVAERDVVRAMHADEIAARKAELARVQKVLDNYRWRIESLRLDAAGRSR